MNLKWIPNNDPKGMNDAALFKLTLNILKKVNTKNMYDNKISQTSAMNTKKMLNVEFH